MARTELSRAALIFECEESNVLVTTGHLVSSLIKSELFSGNLTQTIYIFKLGDPHLYTS
jgi:hypothetical protein